MKKQEESKKHEKQENEDLPAGRQDFKNLENQLKRALADYQNLEKRVVSEKSEWIKLANKGLLLRLLPALDSLVLAEKHTQDEGVKLSISQILSAFKEEGIERIETIGLDFNPNLMEAVHTTTGEEGKVVEELRSGYTLFGQVLRPAQVVVGLAEKHAGDSNPITNEEGTVENWNQDTLGEGEDMLKEDN